MVAQPYECTKCPWIIYTLTWLILCCVNFSPIKNVINTLHLYASVCFYILFPFCDSALCLSLETVVSIPLVWIAMNLSSMAYKNSSYIAFSPLYVVINYIFICYVPINRLIIIVLCTCLSNHIREKWSYKPKIILLYLLM